jgi:hypothetical protein
MPVGESNSIARRWFLGQCGIGLGSAALAELLPASASAADSMLPKPGQFERQAKAVIHLFMAGAPSQLELFDNKPLLSKLEGKPLPESVIGGQRYAFIQPDAAVLGPRFQFRQTGESGAELSTAVPHLSNISDDICLIRSMHTDQFNHAPAQLLLNSGFSQPGRPCLGSWATYGLGAESRNLPAFVVMTVGGISGGNSLWSSGFLPTVHTGVRFRSQGPPVLNLSSPAGISASDQANTFHVLKDLNTQRLQTIQDPEIATRIAAFEMSARMQTSAPELMDLSNETQKTLSMYGCDPAKPSFARSCLLARRMVERGVRFINIYRSGWDAHSDVEGNVRSGCQVTDQASAALVSDLKQRGMLDETLVIWGGEFGRTPMVETNPSLGRAQGRDHHPQAFTMWMAGGGIRRGMTLGQTDDFGFHVTESPVHVHDLQATILHCLGFDHERLTYHHAGRDFRLTDVHGHVVSEILA